MTVVRMLGAVQLISLRRALAERSSIGSPSLTPADQGIVNIYYHNKSYREDVSTFRIGHLAACRLARRQQESHYQAVRQLS